MANWAALQEATHDMPVYKRAKHGLHFKRSDGQIQAEFSGKPCHYLDGGIWKPIDTKLLLGGDGFYGCPHSPVRVHTDGHVRVDGSTYAQYVELPSASGGLVDGDRIVRQFSFGQQVLRVTETGFKSEIILNRIPTLTEARKLVASESGSLPVAYLKSLTTATDANGDIHTFSTLSAFRTWLASAAFPVVIDPDFAVSSGDTGLLGVTTTSYASSRTGSVIANLSTSPSYYTNMLGNYRDGAQYRIGRVFQKFDTSSIGGGSTVTQVNHKIASNFAKANNCNSYVVSCDWSGYDPITTSNDNTVFALPTGVTGDLAFVNIGISLTTSSNLTTTIVNKSGSTYIALLNKQDYDQTENNDVSYYVCGSGNATEGLRPVLTVTYTAGAVKHYMSLLGVGA